MTPLLKALKGVNMATSKKFNPLYGAVVRTNAASSGLSDNVFDSYAITLTGGKFRVQVNGKPLPQGFDTQEEAMQYCVDHSKPGDTK